MQINAIDITNESKLIADYRNNKDSIMQFFDYHPYDSYSKRIQDLQSRHFNRNQLVEVLHDMNRSWGAEDATFTRIDQLKDSNAVVIIGGQQAGLVTGPLYTINKIISIIQLAKQQEEKLQVPVIPVFWIAGEDHDYDEINHVYMPDELKLKKSKLKQYVDGKSSVSHVEIDKETSELWIQQLFTHLPETEHTKDLYALINESLTKSGNFTDFFARIVSQMFKEEGLVLVDSAHDALRQLESDFFCQFIENQTEISHGVASAEKRLSKMGYPINLGTNKTDGHLFYHKDNERILLDRSIEGNWTGKGGLNLTTEELLDVANTTPEYLSNNVVTRPVMQELLFPTLAFIGGLGEISYWAALKPAFQTLQIKMPPVVPRLSYTYIPRRIQKALELTEIDVEKVVERGVSEERELFIQSKHEPSIDDLAEELKGTIEKAHKPLHEAATDIRDDIQQIAEKNLFYLHREVDFLKKRMKLALEEKYEQELSQYDLLTMYLRPENGFQERSWNPLPLINEHGFDWIQKIIEFPVSIHEKHYVVYF